MAKNINVVLTLQDRFSDKMSKARYEALTFKRNLAAAQYVSGKFAGVMGTMEKTAGAAMIGVGSAGAYMAKESLNAYNEFNNRMNDVAGIKRLNTEAKAYTDLIKDAKEATKSVKGMTYDDSADSLKYMALAGWDTVDSMKALVPMLKAVRIAGEDTKVVSDAITDSMGALGLKAGDIEKYLDYSTAVQSASNTSMLQVQNTMIKSGSRMMSLYAKNNAEGQWGAIKDSMAMAGALANTGMKDTEAGTIINSMFTRFVKSGDRAEAQRGLKAIGMSLYDNNQKLKSTTDIFKELSGKVKDLSQQERNDVLSQIGGRFSSQLIALMDAFDVVGEDGKTTIDKITEAVNNSEGALNAYVDAVNSGYGGKAAEMAAEWTNFKIDVGEIISPYAIEAMDYAIEKMPTVLEWCKNDLPGALENGKEVVLEIKDAVSWIWEHKEGLLKALGTAYGLMGAVRVGTAAVEGYGTVKRLRRGLKKQKNVKEIINEREASKNVGKGASPVNSKQTIAETVAETAEKGATVGTGTAGTAGAAGAGTIAGAITIGAASVAAVAGEFYRLYRIGTGKASEEEREQHTQSWSDMDNNEIMLDSALSSGEAFASIWERIKSSISESNGFITNIDVSTSEAGDTTEWWSTVINNLKEGWNGVKTTIDESGAKVKDVSENTSLAASFAGGLKSAWDTVSTGIGDAITKVKDYINWLKQANEQSGIDIASGVAGADDSGASGATIDKPKTPASGPQLLDSMPEHFALGTNYWKGGIAHVNERGGEIMDLPKGTRIYPHDVSEKMVKNNNTGTTLIFNIENFYGEDERYLNRIVNRVGSELAKEM